MQVNYDKTKWIIIKLKTAEKITKGKVKAVRQLWVISEMLEATINFKTRWNLRQYVVWLTGKIIGSFA